MSLCDRLIHSDIIYALSGGNDCFLESYGVVGLRSSPAFALYALYER